MLHKTKSEQVEHRKTSFGMMEKSLKIQTEDKRSGSRRQTLGRAEEKQLNDQDMRYSLTSQTMPRTIMFEVDHVVDRRRC